MVTFLASNVKSSQAKSLNHLLFRDSLSIKAGRRLLRYLRLRMALYVPESAQYEILLSPEGPCRNVIISDFILWRSKAVTPDIFFLIPFFGSKMVGKSHHWFVGCERNESWSFEKVKAGALLFEKNAFQVKMSYSILFVFVTYEI